MFLTTGDENPNAATMLVLVDGAQSAHVADFKRVLPQVAIYDSTESAQLAKLVPPSSLSSDWKRIITAASLYSAYVTRAAHEGHDRRSRPRIAAGE